MNQETNLTTWKTRVFTTISLGVRSAETKHASSGYFFEQRPSTPDGTAIWDIRRHGDANPAAYLRFVLDDNGMVQAQTDVGNATLPSAVSVAEVTHSWATRATTNTITAFLNGQSAE
jgi:hypothetical protein